MKNLRRVLLVLLLITPLAHAQAAQPTTHAADPADTATHMAALYNSIPPNCVPNQGALLPAYFCSGIILRPTTRGAGFYSWSPSPKDEAAGGVSFYYVRQDAKSVGFLEQNGFSLYPATGQYTYQGPLQKNQLKVICAFPVDGGTDARGTPAGCALSRLGTAGPMCQGINVYTADQWITRYQQTGGVMIAQCGFDVGIGVPASASDNTPVDPADGFMQMIYSLQKLGATGFANHTELRIAVWPEDWDAQLPIQSFWYTGSYQGPGWENARKDQADYYKATGEVVPVIKINLPASINDNFGFSYSKDDQAVSPPTD